MKLDVVNQKGTKVGAIDVADEVFAAPIREHLLWEVVKWQRAKQRAGTHSTKRRDEVRGGGKKPYRQKGTGNARQGSSRAPNHVGGGKVFSPKPRSYEYNINKKVKQAALRAVLSLRAKEQRLVVVDDLAVEAVKTKAVVGLLETLANGSALVVDEANDKLGLSMRNLSSAKYLERAGLNVYDVLDHESLVLSKSVAQGLSESLHP
jgi:large subunit ribosomal protein L4